MRPVRPDLTRYAKLWLCVLFHISAAQRKTLKPFIRVIMLYWIKRIILLIFIFCLNSSADFTAMPLLRIYSLGVSLQGYSIEITTDS